VRAYEQIGAVLRAGVRDGRLPPGTLLREGRLASIFGASRSPVKQALEALEAEGLLSRRDGSGLVVGDGSAPPGAGRLDAALLFGAPGAAPQRVRGWQRLHDEVERDLVRCCVLGRFRVNELELAAHHGIGRTVARDVLLRLEGTGVVEKSPRGHWLTVPLDTNRVRHLYALRELLEGAALADAAARLPEGALGAMRARLQAVRAAYPAVEPGALDRLEHDLHVACLHHAENRELLEALRRTRCIIVSSKHLLGADATLPPDDPFLAEHEAVLDALEAGDAAAAVAALHRHLRSARDKVLLRLDAFRSTHTVPALPFVAGPAAPLEEISS